MQKDVKSDVTNLYTPTTSVVVACGTMAESISASIAVLHAMPHKDMHGKIMTFTETPI